MIAVFGGTTEGRTAVGVLEQAGKPFYYSTYGHEQDIDLLHGIRIIGGMDFHALLAFFLDKGVQLVVDAAHPFAEELHTNLIYAARHAGAAIIRFDRIYPPHTSDITWCRDYSTALTHLEEQGVTRLLALTGVQTISQLRPFWEKHECWFRILNRRFSRIIAQKSQFPEDHLIAVETDELTDDGMTANLIERLRPDAILTKESGLSGGFTGKVERAKAAGIKVFVIERPPYPPRMPVPQLTPVPPHTPVPQHVQIEMVNGPFGLRRAIERLLPSFFPLRSGLTTGTCATAAVLAATMHLLDGDEPDAVTVQLPDGETLQVPVGFPTSLPDTVPVGFASTSPAVTVPVGFADGSPSRPPSAEAFCIKDFSDDPDVTRGCRITARVTPSTVPGSGIRFLQGEGIGRVTLPGLEIPVGEPAINPVPRQMITACIRSLTDADLDVTLSVENGRELAKRTFNERVGVVDGISIIGTSGIVMPLSNEAFIQSISREMEVARALGCKAIGLASGKRGEEALLQREPQLRVIHYGNFIGAALQRAHELGFGRVVVGIMIGKAVKLAEGHLDTHSHKVLMNKTFLREIATAAGVNNAASILDSITLARELWDLMPPAFFQHLQNLCLDHCRTAFPTGHLEIEIIKDNTL